MSGAISICHIPCTLRRHRSKPQSLSSFEKKELFHFNFEYRIHMFITENLKITERHSYTHKEN